MGRYKLKRGAGRRPPPTLLRGGNRYLGGPRRSAIAPFGLHRDIGAPAESLVKLHRALFKREQRVVTPHPDALAGVKLGAALAHEDVAGHDDLTAELLDAEPP